MAQSGGQSSRIIIHSPRHTEIWYSKVIPEVGRPLFHRGREYEVVSCQMEGQSYVVEIREPSGRDLVDDLVPHPRRSAEIAD